VEYKQEDGFIFELQHSFFKFGIFVTNYSDLQHILTFAFGTIIIIPRWTLGTGKRE